MDAVVVVCAIISFSYAMHMWVFRKKETTETDLFILLINKIRVDMMLSRCFEDNTFFFKIKDKEIEIITYLPIFLYY